MSMFQRATRQQVPLKIGITGPSGSGKTTAALRIARGLVGATGLIAVVDTENGSASLYADETAFDVVNMNPPYQVAKFTKVIDEAVSAGYHALVIDSASAEWTELLGEKEAMDARGGNGFANWGAITKKHELFLAAVRNAPIHLVLCLRAKQEHVQDKDDKGKTTIRKVGMAAVQRDGMEYELTTVFDIAMDHNYKVSKDRTRLFDGRMEMISVATGQELAAWLHSGAPLADNPTPPPAPATATHETATPAATVEQAPEQSPAPVVGAPQAQGGAQAPAHPTPGQTATAQKAPAPTAPSDEPPAEWVDAMAELAKVTMGMPEKTRTKLVQGFVTDGPEALPALLAEIASIKSVMEPETAPAPKAKPPRTVGAVLAQLPQAAKPEITQATETFVDSVQPDTDEANGGISDDQYTALNTMIAAFGINRDALRAYLANTGKLLPGASGRPTLARFRADEFGKLRDRLNNKKIAEGNETWSARTVRIINGTPTTTFSPMSAVS